MGDPGPLSNNICTGSNVANLSLQTATVRSAVSAFIATVGYFSHYHGHQRFVTMETTDVLPWIPEAFQRDNLRPVLPVLPAGQPCGRFAIHSLSAECLSCLTTRSLLAASHLAESK